MIPDFALIIAGSATTTLAALLMAIRFRKVNRLFLAYARRLPLQSSYSFLLLFLPVAGISSLCFAALTDMESSNIGTATNAITGVDAPGRRADALDSLRAYADRIAAKRETIANMSLPGDQAAAGELADVDTMISQLAARLEKEPGDAKGWKMLGWSYLNTGKTADAIGAYETALKLSPDDTEIKTALQSAKSGNTLAAPQGSATAGDPSANDIKSAAGLSVDEKAAMIRGMVDRLATRLQTSPNDKDGWVRLMRARMMLGEKDAAKAALSKALETFSGDAGVKERLTASARELGVESN